MDSARAVSTVSLGSMPGPEGWVPDEDLASYFNQSPRTGSTNPTIPWTPISTIPGAENKTSMTHLIGIDSKSFLKIKQDNTCG